MRRNCYAAATVVAREIPDDPVASRTSRIAGASTPAARPGAWRWRSPSARWAMVTERAGRPLAVIHDPGTVAAAPALPTKRSYEQRAASADLAVRQRVRHTDDVVRPAPVRCTRPAWSRPQDTVPTSADLGGGGAGSNPRGQAARSASGAPPPWTSALMIRVTQ